MNRFDWETTRYYHTIINHMRSITEIRFQVKREKNRDALRVIYIMRGIFGLCLNKFNLIHDSAKKTTGVVDIYAWFLSRDSSGEKLMTRYSALHPRLLVLMKSARNLIHFPRCPYSPLHHDLGLYSHFNEISYCSVSFMSPSLLCDSTSPGSSCLCSYTQYFQPYWGI